jgi:hypothetical protein
MFYGQGLTVGFLEEQLQLRAVGGLVSILKCLSCGEILWFGRVQSEKATEMRVREPKCVDAGSV